MTWRSRLLAAVTVLLIAVASAPAAPTTYPLAVLPPEHKSLKDPITGAELLFVTTNPARDHNLYFHQRSWLADESLLLFTSDRPRGGLMGYLCATGELVRLTTPQGGLSGATAARDRNSVFAVRGRDVVELALKIEPSADPLTAPSTVIAGERVILTAPEGMVVHGGLTENSDGTLLGLDVRWPNGEQGVAVVNIATGELRDVCRLNFAGHLQFSRTNPNLMSVAGLQDRLVVIDLAQGGRPRSIHHQVQGEWATHECWWINDSLTFCGGYRDKESHLKVINAHTGEVRIVGAGAWVPWRGSGDDVLNRWNWWHAAGHESGRWIVADNWYGDIVLFDGHTTQMRRLTLGHRTYGGGEHPHPGWDRSGQRVVFTSQMLGGVDVCVATIPQVWPPDPANEGLLITSGSPAAAADEKPVQ
jgi:oligogalacturonide lyase